MAKPRVFISSTFYDLRHVREDLDRFVLSLGYEPVRHEIGKIPYSKTEKLETSAYREIDFCDILVCIIGGRFGSESQENPGYSITQTELLRAIEKDIPIYIFIEKPVLTEFDFYNINKDNKDVKFKNVDDIRIFNYIETVKSLPKGNPIAGFETLKDITSFLIEQWAGLFQRFLQQQPRNRELTLIDEINISVKTLRELIKVVSDDKNLGNEAIKSILLSNHPLFSRLAKITKTPYRVFFSDRAEMGKWLKARGWAPWDPTDYYPESLDEWNHKDFGWLVFKHEIFDENDRLISISETDWDEDWLELVPKTDPPSPADDDIPF